MTQIFNTPFEISMRALILLNVYGEANIDRITLLDIIATYGKSFGILDYDLNGENPTGNIEINQRRKLMKEAMRFLVLERYVTVKERENLGFLYSITPLGNEIAGGMSSDYAIQYKQIAEIVLRKTVAISDGKLLSLVTKPRKGD